MDSSGYRNELERLAFKYGTDKCPRFGHCYTDFYHLLFADKRKSVHKVLEIGVGSEKIIKHPNYVNGASLYMWRDFFPNANIYGIDIRKDVIFRKKRIQTFLCNQTDSVGLLKLIKKIGSDIDIVIDDGSHRSEDIMASFSTLMPILKKSAVYVIEDTNRYKMATITRSLEGYDYQVLRRATMLSPDDRLIVVTNKNG